VVKVPGALVLAHVRLEPTETMGSVGFVLPVVSGLPGASGRGLIILCAMFGCVAANCAEIVCVPASANAAASHHEENVRFILQVYD
jgi:hypothetical protein